MVRKSSLVTCAAALVVLTASAIASAGTIVVANDEWTLSNTGFSSAPSTPTYATNVATFFTGGGAGTFHAYSTNFGLTQSSLTTTMSGAGHTYTTGTGITWDLPTLLGYDGIYLAGLAVPDLTVLAAYVNAGGNVYLAAGTATLPGGALGEATYWNAFLNPFGLGFGTTYNGVIGNQAIANAHPIFSGVTSLYQNNGNDTLDINVLDPSGVVLVTSATGGHGLYAIYDSSVTAVPVPGAAWLGLSLLGGIAAAGTLRRRRSAAVLAD